MLRSAVVLSSCLVTAACSTLAIVPDPRVAERGRQGDADSAVAVLNDTTICAVTIRDPSGTLHDAELRDDGPRALDLRRVVSKGPWRIHNSGYPSARISVLAMPPGRYELVAYELNGRLVRSRRGQRREPRRHALQRRRATSGSPTVPHRGR